MEAGDPDGCDAYDVSATPEMMPHVLPVSARVCSANSKSSRLCVADTIKRKRAAPRGTVGNAMASVAERVVRLAACPVMTVKAVTQPPSDT
jgi:hypothetical protein